MFSRVSTRQTAELPLRHHSDSRTHFETGLRIAADTSDTNLEALSGRRHAPSASEADATRNCRRRPRGLSRPTKVHKTTLRTAERRPRAPNIPLPPGGSGRLAFMPLGRPGRATQDQGKRAPWQAGQLGPMRDKQDGPLRAEDLQSSNDRYQGASQAQGGS